LMIARHRASRCNRFDVLIRHLPPAPAKRTHRALWIAETVTVRAGGSRAPAGARSVWGDYPVVPLRCTAG
jgi:hypothetical protein